MIKFIYRKTLGDCMQEFMEKDEKEALVWPGCVGSCSRWSVGCAAGNQVPQPGCQEKGAGGGHGHN